MADLDERGLTCLGPSPHRQVYRIYYHLLQADVGIKQHSMLGPQYGRGINQ